MSTAADETVTAADTVDFDPAGSVDTASERFDMTAFGIAIAAGGLVW